MTAGDERDRDPALPEDWPAESVGRLAKARALRERGIHPYPNRFARTHRLGEITAAHGEKTIEQLEAEKNEVRIAGRVMLKRPMGKATFATLSDGADRLQVYLRIQDVGEEAYRTFEDLVDLGDFVGVAGTVMRTRKGELSVQAGGIEFLSKALLPPPEKWHGLADVEVRYRQRYLDLIANPEVRQTFLARSAMVAEMRRFLDARGYVEVETPMMQPIAGGAVARPFVTHHNTLDMDLFLRIAPELYLKRLVVGGLERVYEINRNFRNEGISAMHNPEFTMLEFYTAYFDCQDVMAITEELVEAAARRVRGDRPFRYRDRDISFRRPFARLGMREAILQAARQAGLGLDEKTLGDEEALLRWTESDVLVGRRSGKGAPLGPERYRGLSQGKRIAQLFEDLAEQAFWDPTFIVDYPTEVSPLAKARPDDPTLTERFELYAGGMEIANGFSELNDPLEQRARFVEQLAQREKGDLEAHQMDEDYVRALGHGLPPTGGCGVGIDRLAMILTDSPSIRDVILFPHMRPRETE
ncbi:MAG TPA: lysine--tRNA ligase [Vicinamibacteria bacterium]|nr:lysine--tRNA ligase [Vicinamibacteria bacterium]